jgi:hypothetical protein
MPRIPSPEYEFASSERSIADFTNRNPRIADPMSGPTPMRRRFFSDFVSSRR